MTLLILGLLLWTLAHLFKRIAPSLREPMGDKGKGLVALVLLGSIVLMVFGYKASEYSPLWAAPVWGNHLVSLLMLIALYFTSPGPKKGALFHKMRHPMLTGFIIWAAAHLFVNGDVASLILFGGLGVWAITEIIVINRAEPDWTPNPKGTIAKDGMFLVASAVLVGVIGYIHGMIGPSPFG
ncbi:NnrU family protein [Actibacterium pelagium]|uniref:Membrane protein n=1 Tax=Actibacterium pelagium TaxID=2029103 RepID=A0A917EP05_9RHOB|nr:NnrU family protein [Actibacterium pelagium]GGE61149.1 membrane protein [Actibacterium pelagium]